MSKFKENMVVGLNVDGEIQRGVIKTLYHDLGIAIVEMENGDTKKVRLDGLIVLDENEPVEEVESESIEGAKVITKDQFIEAIHVLVSPEEMLKIMSNVDPSKVMIRGLSVLCVGLNMTDKLFQDKEEIEITKDQLFEAISENTKPSAIVDSVDGKMTVSQVLPISLTSGLVLMRLLHILFDEKEND